MFDEDPPNRLFSFVHIVIADGLSYRLHQTVKFDFAAISDLLGQLLEVVVQLADLFEVLDV